MDLDIELLDWQQKVWLEDARFNVIAAGRRTGKSKFAAFRMVVTAINHPGRDVWYVAPTQKQAKDIMWKDLLKITEPFRRSHNVNNLDITLINGATISLKGSDRPDNMRGVGLVGVVLDEYAEMKPQVWEEIIFPMLADYKGWAIFIGTPKGRNHFYDTYQYALEGGDPEYRAWHFTTFDNPCIDPEEIKKAKRRMSSHAFRQEFMASFESVGSEIFNEDWVKISPIEPHEGEYYIACDLAGFAENSTKKRGKKDWSAIAIVKANSTGWYVKDILYGRWTFDETLRNIFNAVQKYRPVAVGIERGIAQQAVMSPLQDMQRRTGFFFDVTPLTHGNRNKTTRIVDALQGKFENGYITLNEGEWNVEFLDELFNFPDRLVHDDLIDALAYIDQLAVVMYDYDPEEYDTEYEVLDEISGY